MHPHAHWWRACAAMLLLATACLLPARHTLAASQPIYDDALGAGWENWSWATNNPNATSPTHGGSKSIQVTFGAYTGLYLHHAGVSTAGYTKLRFFVHGGGSGGQKVTVCASNACANKPSYNFTAQANSWTQVDVPLSALGSPATITDLLFQEAAGANQTAMFFDDMALVNDESPDGPAFSAGTVLPGALPADGVAQGLVKIRVSDPQGAADITTVTLDGGPLGVGTIPLRDDGRSGDGAANDGVYGAGLRVAPGTPAGEYTLLVTATDKAGHSAASPLGAFVVLARPGGNVPAALPQRLGWGTNEWDADGKGNWQVSTGVPWGYVYQYITTGWETWGPTFVQRFVKQAWDNDYVPVVSVYLMLGMGGNTGEGGDKYAQKLQNPAMVQSYLASLQAAALQAKGEKPVIFHLEPDFYGYMQQLSTTSSRPAGVRLDDPSSYPVALNIPGYPNTLAGFGKRMVDVIHQTAPNVLAAPHASTWATDRDPNNETPENVLAMARRTAAFMNAMGGAEADLFFVEWSDRDAGSGLRPWWDEANKTLPRYSRATLWQNALSAAAGKRLILWQVPAGHMSLDNTCERYRDNRSSYAFSHPRDLAGAGVIAVLFGDGADCMTEPANDGGFIAQQGGIAYAPPATPTGLTPLGAVGARASLAWNERTEPDIAGYRLSYKGPGALSGQFTTGPLNTATLLLPKSGTYRVTVAAIDAMGNASAESAEVEITTDADAQLTFAPLAAR